MKTRLLIIIGFAFALGFVIANAYAYHDGIVHPTPNAEMAKEEFTLATLEWSQLNYRITNSTGTAKVIVTDHDMNKISSYVDTLNVSVFSDSFQEGITLKLYETERSSGIFEKTFTLSEKRSAPNILYVQEGDTATVTYTDTTLPSDNEFSEIIMTETTLIGHSEPPLERVPVQNARITDLDKNQINFPIVGEQILLISDIASGEQDPQEFIWIAQTVDSQNIVESLSWINGTINPNSSFSPSTSWIPQNIGNYRTTFFVWESIDNPTALSPPVEIEFTVLPEPAPKPILTDGTKSLQEHYEIDIIGLKDEYVLGEKYSFYFIISGYGHECAGINISYPNENGELYGWGQEPLCDSNLVMHNFEMYSTDRKDLFGNITIKNTGTYTVTVIFDKPNKYFPTTVSKEFRVMEK